MDFQLQTTRLQIQPISEQDDAFIFELLNSEGWIKFIGNRNILTRVDAKSYIAKIAQAPHIHYYTVKLIDSQNPIGLVTLIKRDYLEHHDIGFAFLPQYAKHGYAKEAARALLLEILKDSSHSKILATTIPSNTNSIHLLQKLGLYFEKEIQVDSEALHVYGASADELKINFLTQDFFAVFTNKNNKAPELEKLNSICLPACSIKKSIANTVEQYSLKEFIEPRKKILSNGILKEFEEFEISHQTKVLENIAIRNSKYLKSGYENGNLFQTKGTKKITFQKTNYGWKIAAFEWEDEQ